jgi:membrane protein required for colicin V production
MVVTDWVLLAVLLVSLVLGAWRGLVYEVMSVLGWVVAFVLAQWWAPDVAGRLPMSDVAEPVRYAAAFVLVFVVAAFAGGLVAWATKKLVEAVGLRPVDRTLGAAFGLVRGVVLLLAVAVVVGMTPLKTSVWWTESNGAGVLATALRGLKPVLPDEFGKYLPA